MAPVPEGCMCVKPVHVYWVEGRHPGTPDWPSSKGEGPPREFGALTPYLRQHLHVQVDAASRTHQQTPWRDVSTRRGT